MSGGTDVHHTSFAVRDALGWARRLRRELGATPVAGESLPEYRYLLLWVGSETDGATLELLEATGPGFLQRFLDTRGEGPHHLTFMVPDLRRAVADVRDLGLSVVGESHDHPSWREAFILPEPTHRTVIQLAQSDRHYPPPSQLLASTDRDVDAFPSASGAVDRRWWEEVWDAQPRRQARLGHTVLGSTDLTRTTELFAGILGAVATLSETGVRLDWPSGGIDAHEDPVPGVRGIELHGAGAVATGSGRATLPGATLRRSGPTPGAPDGGER